MCWTRVRKRLTVCMFRHSCGCRIRKVNGESPTRERKHVQLEKRCEWEENVPRGDETKHRRYLGEIKVPSDLSWFWEF